MSVNRLDLLPEDRRRALRRAYLLRVATVAVVLAIILVTVTTALLVPAYIYLVSALDAGNAHLADIKSTLSLADQTELGKRLAVLEANGQEIAALGATPSAAEIIREVLAVSREGVVLSGIQYAPVPGTLTLSGVAATRNDLRVYQLALVGTPGFSAADLPVSSYAKDSDIPFTINVTLASSTSP